MPGKLKLKSNAFRVLLVVLGLCLVLAGLQGMAAADQVKIGNVTVDKAERSVIVPGKVNMREGLIELLACSTRGKLHESILELDAEPHDIQAALLLAGLKPGAGGPGTGSVRSPGDPVRVLIEWKENGKTVRVRGEQLVRDKPGGRPMEDVDWDFTGSFTGESGFAADIGRTIVATYYDATAVLNNPLPSSLDDTVYHANTSRVPPVGTPVELILSPGKRVSQVAAALPEDVSLRREAEDAAMKGIRWLLGQQKEDGHWGTEEHPALTGLAVTAIVRSPGFNKAMLGVPEVEKGLKFILSSVKEDGAIYRSGGLAAYNTSICLMALTAVGETRTADAIRRARAYLIGIQQDDGEKGIPDSPSDGGWGYEPGGEKSYADLSNTIMVLEALKTSETLEQDGAMIPAAGGRTQPDWNAALEFLKKCQHLRSVNREWYVSDDERDKGGFIYRPGESKLEEQLPDGKRALRAYGSMTYAGLLSMIYADLNRQDPRVRAAHQWLAENYSVDENPGVGAQGLYYYYQMMAKTLAVYGEEVLALKDGRRVEWRKTLIKKLLELQEGEGYWVNANGRWWENDPVLVTSYSLIALEISLAGLR